jgi:pimeloyl-ACP methyl ester carboxylesterase
MDEQRWTHHEAIVNGVRLHYVEAGTGPLVVLLHGFPEFWWSWHHQIGALAAAGYRVVAPDMRGYNTSEKPPGVGSYRLDRLTADIAALIRYLGAQRAAVVGHDWGGVVAWALPVHHPAVVERLVVLNAPHPGLFRDVLRRVPAQRWRSWYAAFFQLPWLPEAIIRAGNFAVLDMMLRRGANRPGAFTTDDIQRYKTAVGQPGALTAMLNYYRALARSGTRGTGTGRIDVPTLLIWGERDVALDLANADAERLQRWVPQIGLVRIPDASHWVQQDAPERVNEALVSFLEGYRG